MFKLYIVSSWGQFPGATVPRKHQEHWGTAAPLNARSTYVPSYKVLCIIAVFFMDLEWGLKLWFRVRIRNGVGIRSLMSDSSVEEDGISSGAYVGNSGTCLSLEKTLFPGTAGLQNWGGRTSSAVSLSLDKKEQHYQGTQVRTSSSWLPLLSKCQWKLSIDSFHRHWRVVTKVTKTT